VLRESRGGTIEARSWVLGRELMVVLQDEVVRVARWEDEGEKKKGDGGLQIFSRRKTYIPT
jgi:hypothetical protein